MRHINSKVDYVIFGGFLIAMLAILIIGGMTIFGESEVEAQGIPINQHDQGIHYYIDPRLNVECGVLISKNGIWEQIFHCVPLEEK